MFEYQKPKAEFIKLTRLVITTENAEVNCDNVSFWVRVDQMVTVEKSVKGKGSVIMLSTGDNVYVTEDCNTIFEYMGFAFE
jgi:hypothetical protein